MVRTVPYPFTVPFQYSEFPGGFFVLSSDSENQATVNLESIISTAELSERPTRAPNHVAENHALIALAEKMATSPHDILQKLAETALNLCHAQTCGISL